MPLTSQHNKLICIDQANYNNANETQAVIQSLMNLMIQTIQTIKTIFCFTEENLFSDLK